MKQSLDQPTIAITFPEQRVGSHDNLAPPAIELIQAIGIYAATATLSYYHQQATANYQRIRQNLGVEGDDHRKLLANKRRAVGTLLLYLDQISLGA